MIRYVTMENYVISAELHIRNNVITVGLISLLNRLIRRKIVLFAKIEMTFTFLSKTQIFGKFFYRSSLFQTDYLLLRTFSRRIFRNVMKMLDSLRLYTVHSAYLVNVYTLYRYFHGRVRIWEEN